ncbi:MAG: tryptophan synthase subunit alpha [Desulfobacterota bacterium]|nr:tryptophan synthase subunit alpha [Thermodesulfobacteriota bacterium]MDW8002706.1 tryptophan synthase subunit alpha [Deltaproteobacteria bacterium]
MALKEVFDTLKREGKKALIPYITGGDPTKEKTIEIMDFFAKEGADIIELGVPFSDPMADGPVIQRAMERAIKSKTTLFDILEIVRKFKKQAKIPVVLMGYMNPFFSYGFERLIYEAKESGVDGILCVDLPYEEAYPFWMCAKRGGLDFVCLVSPLTNRSRIARIKRYASGFIYFVSVTGVTGERESLPEDVKGMLIDTKNLTKLPVVLGFGISKAETIEEFFDFTDGFVIGSALVRRLEEVSFDVESKGFKDFFYALERACHKKR